MKRYINKCRNKYKNIVGIILSIIGVLIVINVMPYEFLLFIIGIALIAIGILLIKIK